MTTGNDSPKLKLVAKIICEIEDILLHHSL